MSPMGIEPSTEPTQAPPDREEEKVTPDVGELAQLVTRLVDKVESLERSMAGG